jgi:hypothetical protein
MTFMPIIDDHMLAAFRRTGKRRGSYRQLRSGGRVMAGGAHVVPQRSPGCAFVGQFCRNSKGQPGSCDANLNCILDWNPGPDPFRL